MDRVSLKYYSSEYIVDFVSRHPIDWSNRKLAKRGGSGDMAGVTPTPAVYEFLALLAQRKGLFTQKEYKNYCFDVWSSWLENKNDQEKAGVAAKLYRNFYPSMIDSLHVWSLLVETGEFSQCYLDSTEDALSKSDLTVVRLNGAEIKIALSIGSYNARRDRDYKRNYRGRYDGIVLFDVELSMDRPRRPGNKRWYVTEDFSSLLNGPGF